MSEFKLQSKYSPAGDQPEAIKSILNFLEEGYKWQTLWGVTGSGKTFTMANVIQKIQKPTLVIAHNKTLAAQLAQEFKEFFPDNAVHYFVSYYDYYQPEAYVAKTDTYIEKEATINAEIDRLRHAATKDLLTRKDVIIVASVSCIYGIGDIDLYTEQVFEIKVGEEYEIEDLLKNLVSMQFKRAGADFKPGNFIIHGDTLEIFPASEEAVYTIEFWGNEVSQITRRNYLTGEIYDYMNVVEIFPAKHTVTTKDRIEKIIPSIKQELEERLEYLKEIGDVLKYERLKTKVEYDIEMLQEVGYVNGIENYSRYLDGREEGAPPATLMDYFKGDYICFVDESHMTLSQIGGMYAGDRARKENLVGNGFRLPSAMDNRPLKFDEFEGKLNQVVCVSATPGKIEIEKTCKSSEVFFEFDAKEGKKWQPNEDYRVIPQVIRPTGLLDPIIEIRNMEFMIDDIMTHITEIVENNERMLITTVTKRSSEELTDYLLDNGIKVKYLHSEVETLERIEILKELREGKIDVIVGVNLLREGLDLPEVSKIAILDADKQGFLRSESSLIQIIGRAARNSKGKVYMYVERRKTFDFDNPNFRLELDHPCYGKLYREDNGKYVNGDGLVISNAMKKAIDLTYYRRGIQNEYNIKNNINPETIFSTIKSSGIKKKDKDSSIILAKDIKREIAKLELEMDIASSNLEYEKAAEFRDRIIALKNKKKR